VIFDRLPIFLKKLAVKAEGDMARNFGAGDFGEGSGVQHEQKGVALSGVEHDGEHAMPDQLTSPASS
jgi:hypothetical protein